MKGKSSCKAAEEAHTTSDLIERTVEAIRQRIEISRESRQAFEQNIVISKTINVSGHMNR
jgi:hypothetical protein